MIPLVGCSLLFDGSKHEGSEGADAGPEDAAGFDASDPGFPCSRHRDCRDTMLDENYVCVPGPGAVAGEFYCASACTAPDDCGAVGGGFPHDEGSICLASNDCGCGSSMHCLDPMFPSCNRPDQRCEAPNCDTNADCELVNPGTFCFGGYCQLWACTDPADCSDEPSRSACAIGPAGTIRYCSDNCVADMDCPSGTSCQGMPPMRACTR